MPDPFIGEIKLFAGDYPPDGWAFCDGQLLAIRSATALFSLIGTIYGGDGKVTFALPDLRGNLALGAGDGPGLTPRVPGEIGGETQVTLTELTVPPHSHTLYATNIANGGIANETGPQAANIMAQAGRAVFYGPPDGNEVAMNGQTFTPQGGNAPHPNLSPYLNVNFIIALQGIFPSFNEEPTATDAAG